jgi:hypothetical protein
MLCVCVCVYVCVCVCVCVCVSQDIAEFAKHLKSTIAMFSNMDQAVSVFGDLD